VNDNALITSILSLATIIVVYLIRAKLGETEADKYVKLATTWTAKADVIGRAALMGVMQVENVLKKDTTLTNDQLKEAAIKYAIDVLKAWGTPADGATLNALVPTVETVYQTMVKK
jgi:hypothetical protein